MAETVFDPVAYSLAENQFLLENVGDPPIVALKRLPAGVNPKAVTSILQTIFELGEAERRIGEPWCGLDAIKASIQAYVQAAEGWAKDKRKGRPRFPSMYSFDSKHRAFRGGIGSDSGQVRTYFKPDGTRANFAVELVNSGELSYQPEWAAQADAQASELIVDQAKLRIECSICGHTETFKADSRSSFNAARARISRHLRTTKDDADAHRELHMKEFGTRVDGGQ